ncbi:ABC transporter substrate-binding protein [Streptomonospora salina]|uniref:Peptide/nickel transport system substrate-binding protein n=1 Tax=Streptomonospora salina TaxID=104205 RepID=A0A841EK81_9ACTN|nr:ABC transporter substrate-binding protein [Streptomonospora salina]MBB6000750.1 peptide/nickel transport system substrate-binding protein [Streptomonospora salina]
MPIETTRRAALGLGALGAGAVLLGGCSGDPAPERPRSGGRVRALFAGGGANESMDPHVQPLFIDQARHKALYEKLTQFNADMSPRGQLAEDWTVDEGGARWRFRLRAARFHDGRTVTADDVLASYARITAPADTPRNGRTLLARVDLGNSRAVEERTVELRLTSPTYELPALLAGTGMHIVPADFDDRDPATDAVGSGAFTLASFEAGRSMRAERFGDHWDGGARIGELEILSAESEARGNALLGGQGEYIHDMSATFARSNEDNPDVTVVRTPNSGMAAMAMKTDRAPFDDPRVRKAFRLLVDRERLVDVVSAGTARVGNDVFGSGYRYFDDDLPQRGRDLDRARRLLREAGAQDLEVALDTSEAAPGFVDAATLFAEQAAEAGATVDVRVGNQDTYFSDILDQGVFASYRSGSMPIPNHLALRMVSDAPQNVTGWKRAGFDEAFARAQATADEQERTRRYHELQQELHDDGGLIVWGYTEWINATAASLRGVERDAPPNTADWARFDRVWLE